MKIVEQLHVILYPLTPEDWLRELKLIEDAGRTAYLSDDKITATSHEAFIKMIIGRDHGAVLEFGDMQVCFITDRGISHEIVRHRLCSFIQESTRYCNYSSDKFGNEVTFVEPSGCDRNSELWRNSCERAEGAYLDMLKAGYTPQQARAVLPNCTKTKIQVKANFREWRHIFKLRAISKAAHPDMRRLMIPLYQQCREECPIIFDMGEPEV